MLAKWVVSKSKRSVLEDIRATDFQQQTHSYFESSASRWKEIYERGDLEARVYQERLELALEFVDDLGLPPPTEVLEIGCGAGSAAAAMARRGFLVEAVDLVPVMAGLTRELATEAHVDRSVRVSCGDMHNLGFKDGAFDLVFALGVLPWTRSLYQALREIARVLKGGGYLVASADNRWRLNYVLDPLLNPLIAPMRQALGNELRRLGLRKPRTTVRARHYSIPEFDRVLSSAGLEKTESATVGFGPFSFLGHRILPDTVAMKVHRTLQNLANRDVPVMRSAGTHYITVARKIDPLRS